MIFLFSSEMTSTDLAVHEYGQKESTCSQIFNLPFEDYSLSFGVIFAIPRVL